MAALKLFFLYLDVTHYPETMQQRAGGGGTMFTPFSPSSPHSSSLPLNNVTFVINKMI